MANNIEHQNKGELVTNCDQLQNNEVVVTTPVESRIMSIRGKQIMIDRDLAELYGVETKRLNEAVKRNIERFPERFRFQLTKEEMAELVANCDRFNSLKHSTVHSYAFTEQGVAMLSTILRSETAIQVSIRIMDAFVAMRHFMTTNAEVFRLSKNADATLPVPANTSKKEFTSLQFFSTTSLIQPDNLYLFKFRKFRS